MRRIFAWLWLVPVPLTLALDALTGIHWLLTAAGVLAAGIGVPVLIRVQRVPDRARELLFGALGQILALGIVASVPTMSTTAMWLSLVTIAMLTRFATTWLGILGIVVLAAANIGSPLLMPDGVTFGLAAMTVIVVAVAIGVTLRSADRSLIERQATATEAERRRIATELHDLIAHEVTGIVVLAQAAGRSDNAALTSTALQRIEESGTRALTEIRRLVSENRTEGGARTPVAAGPQALRDRVTSYGDHATIDIAESIDTSATPKTLGHDGMGTASAPAIDEHVWPVLDRVLVETLTNVRRHAGPDAEVKVRLHRDDCAPETLLMSVTNAPGTRGVGAGSGTGLSSLRARVSHLGGSIEAGPDPDGGWSVRTRLPATAPSPAPASERSEEPR
ncbi:sensor histidine kinase [Brevibacterium atlanticum]|uniref:sensor histidine kinase n=1 Tax=Brevibacterium atlanticum TaxID=2697563 RepID=UPI00142371CD|nr:histidine kinase [Brevibacterium atlanticum]